MPVGREFERFGVEHVAVDHPEARVGLLGAGVGAGPAIVSVAGEVEPAECAERVLVPGRISVWKMTRAAAMYLSLRITSGWEKGVAMGHAVKRRERQGAHAAVCADTRGRRFERRCSRS